MAKTYEHTILQQEIKIAIKYKKLVDQFLVKLTSNRIKA